MTDKGYSDSRIRVTRWEEIQANAKAAAQTAAATGDTSELTALGRGYYEKITGVKVNA